MDASFRRGNNFAKRRAGASRAMATCSNCTTLLGDDKRKSQCGLCKEQRVPEPAIYCGKKCAQAHWKKEHKAWHEECAALLGGVDADARKRLEEAQLAEYARDDLTKDEDKFIAHYGKAEKAMLRHDFREAVKQSRKAIAVRPDDPNGYDMLASAFHNSGDLTNAATYFLKVMELSKEGTEYHSRVGDEPWAVAACRAYSAFTISSCTATPPAWGRDLRFVKHVADRAIELCKDEAKLAASLNVRAIALLGGGIGEGLSSSEEVALPFEMCDKRCAIYDA